MRLLTDNLFQRVLIDPAKRLRADRMLAVSGYVTANMVYRHMECLDENGCNPSIDVVAGMVPMQGMNKTHHQQFVKFSKEPVRGCDFSCMYAVSVNPVHAKVFIWMRGKKPVAAFAGSANYTARGFGENQNEIMIQADPKDALGFYKRTAGQSLYCFDSEIENRISLNTRRRREDYGNDSDNSVDLSLLTRDGKETHRRAGLNWGQRPGRDPDQAYIPVSQKVARRKFFPPRARPFTVSTDDGRSFILAVAQDGDKALHTPEGNSILGRYFRDRLNLNPGQYVKKRHLEEYGRTDVTFTKMDDENYSMDFDVRPKKR